MGIGHWALGSGHWALGIGHRALGIGHRAFGIGHWALGHWTLGIGQWASGTGHWAVDIGALGIGHWASSLGIGHRHWAIGAFIADLDGAGAHHDASWVEVAVAECEAIERVKGIAQVLGFELLHLGHHRRVPAKRPPTRTLRKADRVDVLELDGAQRCVPVLDRARLG